jgi:hypothetical protein
MHNGSRGPFQFQLSEVEIVPFLGMMTKWFGLESFKLCRRLRPSVQGPVPRSGKQALLPTLPHRPLRATAVTVTLKLSRTTSLNISLRTTLPRHPTPPKLKPFSPHLPNPFLCLTLLATAKAQRRTQPLGPNPSCPPKLLPQARLLLQALEG